MSDISYDKIEISGIDYISIEYLDIEQKVNEHARAAVRLIIDEQAGKEYLESSYEEEIVSVYADGSVIFCGLIQNVTLKYEADHALLLLSLVSCSIMWDIQKQNKSYQRIGTSFVEIMNKAVSETGMIINHAEASVSEAMIVQYQETNWQFILRMAAYMKAPVFVDVTVNKPVIYIGTDKDGECSRYTRKVIERGVLRTYKTKSNSSELIPQYQKPAYIGKIFRAIVKDVSRADIRVWIPELDECFDDASNTWFSYLTAYSSEINEAGIYCMPVAEEPIRIFLPSEGLKDIFASSGPTVRGIQENNEERCFQTPEGMTILFGKEGLTINCKDCTTFIQLNKDGTIAMASNKSIGILSKTNIKMKAIDGSVSMNSKGTMELVTPGAYIGFGKAVDENGNSTNESLVKLYASQIYMG